MGLAANVMVGYAPAARNQPYERRLLDFSIGSTPNSSVRQGRAQLWKDEQISGVITASTCKIPIRHIITES
jgi:hypothetical protein